MELEGKTRIGLFPFTREMPRLWLHLFGMQGPAGFGKTPRALLMQLLLPALEYPEQVPQQFPPQSVTLPPLALSYWTSFEEQYCGGWSTEERKRLRKEQAARAARASATTAAEAHGTGAEAVSVVHVDSAVPEAVLQKLRSLPAIKLARAIRLVGN